MLRVLVVITRGEAGGAQVHVLELVRGLRGQVDFQVAIGDREFLALELEKSGIPVHVVEGLQRSVSPRSDLRALRELRTLIRTVKPNLVHTHSSKAGLLGRLAARSLGVPVIHTAHAWAFSDGQPRRRKAATIPIEALAGRITDRFVVVSDADREVGQRYGVARPSQVRIVHNGISDVAARARPEEAGIPVVCMVARLAAPKDPLLLLRALAGIPQPWRLRLVGDGPDRPAVEAALSTLGIQDRVELVGTSLEVPALLAQSHIGVLISKQEGFPLVVLEAMRAGLPVVASDVGGIREAVVQGETGFLVGRGEEEALRQALQRLIDSPRLRSEMGTAGRRRFEENFTVDKMLRGTLSVYQEVAV